MVHPYHVTVDSESLPLCLPTSPRGIVLYEIVPEVKILPCLVIVAPSDPPFRVVSEKETPIESYI